MKPTSITPFGCSSFHLLQVISRKPCPRPLSVVRCLHQTGLEQATALPATTPGPPPAAPMPSVSHYRNRVARQLQRSEILQKGQNLQANQTKSGGPLRGRFWKDVIVKELPGINLDHPQCNSSMLDADDHP